MLLNEKDVVELSAKYEKAVYENIGLKNKNKILQDKCTNLEIKISEFETKEAIVISFLIDSLKQAKILKEVMSCFGGEAHGK